MGCNYPLRRADTKGRRVFAWAGDLKRRQIVRVAGVYTVGAWATFQVINTLFQALEIPKWSITLALGILVLGLPVVLIVTWVIDRQRGRLPESLDGDTRRAGPVWLDTVIVAAVVAVVGVIGWQLASRGSSRLTTKSIVASAPMRSIAVLPFVSFSKSADDGFFADGLTEELINSLAQGPDLQVAGRTSSFYFKGRNEDLRDVAARLGVAHILEGSVRRSGETLRITAQLVKAADGFHLWSQTYDRPGRDAFVIQSEIASAVADALRARLGAAGVPLAARDPGLYALELESRARLRTKRLQDVRAARAGFVRLTEREPNNAAAWSGLSEAVMQLAQDHLAIDFTEATRISDFALRRALQLDPDAAVVLRAQAFAERVQAIRSGNTDHLRTAAAALSRAVALEPRNADGLFLYGSVLSALERDGEALPVLQRALAIDPLNRGARTVLGATLAGLGRVAEADRQYETTVQLFPDYSVALLSLGRLRVATGQLEAAVPPLLRARNIDNDTAAGLALAHIYVNLGMDAEFEQTLAALGKTPTAANLAIAVRLLAHQRHDELLAFARREYASSRDPLWGNAEAMMAMFTGDYETARRWFAKTTPGLFLPEPRPDGTRIDMMTAATAMAGAGDKAQSQRVLRLVLASPVGVGPVDPATVTARVNAHAGLGDQQGAIAELEQAVARGYRTPIDFDMFTRIDRYPLMRPMAAHPRLQAVLAQIAAKNAAVRARLTQPHQVEEAR